MATKIRSVIQKVAGIKVFLYAMLGLMPLKDQHEILALLLHLKKSIDLPP
jgi:hypothetical protein